MTHNWRISQTVTCEDTTTHQQTDTHEDCCGLCMCGIHTTPAGIWVHNRGDTELCHERAA